MTEDQHERLVALALAIQADNRFGGWSNPVMLGVLLAIEELR